VRSFGGVQLSGIEAWQAVTGAVGERRARALFYKAGSSKMKALLGAVGQSTNADVLLVWHLHLLKLLPVLNVSTTTKIAVFLHGIEAWRRHSLLMHGLLRKVDLILANTEFTWTQFVAMNPALHCLRHRVIHLGTGSALGSASPTPARTPVAVMVGRLDKREDYKGHRQVIEAWRRVSSRMPGAELWIVGDGDLRPVLEDLARREAPAHSVRFFGRVSDAQKEQLLSQSRCFVLPSRGEGFGLAYLEAMRIGRPCLVSDADAGREVVNPPEAGLAVDPGNPADIVDAVCRLLTPGPDWDRWSSFARARYEASFTSEHFRNRLIGALLES
jgi:phosphatidylinositol alpha-1,6-mannosyltransferase